MVRSLSCSLLAFTLAATSLLAASPAIQAVRTEETVLGPLKVVGGQFPDEAVPPGSVVWVNGVSGVVGADRSFRILIPAEDVASVRVRPGARGAIQDVVMVESPRRRNFDNLYPEGTRAGGATLTTGGSSQDGEIRDLLHTDGGKQEGEIRDLLRAPAGTREGAIRDLLRTTGGSREGEIRDLLRTTGGNRDGEIRDLLRTTGGSRDGEIRDLLRTPGR